MEVCTVEHCKSHEYVEKNMNRLEDISVRLTEGQTMMISIMSDLKRTGQRIEKLEANQEYIQVWMWKIVGVLSAAGLVLPVVMTYLMRPT